MNVWKMETEIIPTENQKLLDNEKINLFIGIKKGNTYKMKHNNNNFIFSEIINNSNTWKSPVIIGSSNNTVRDTAFYLSEVVCFNKALDNDKIEMTINIFKKYYSIS